jgi:NAD(P)H-hydrate epimerase
MSQAAMQLNIVESRPLHAAALLTSEECRSAEKDAITSGTSGETLMENAGKALIDLITQQFKPRPTLVICGTGNNGGDGFVVARMLKEKNWQVTLAILGNADEIKNDAKTARDICMYTNMQLAGCQWL